jgi:hypothetical protein
MPAIVPIATHILPRIDIILFISSQPPCPARVKIALQDHRRGYGIDVSFPPPAPRSALLKRSFRYGSRQSFIPENDPDLWLHRGSKHLRELAHDGGLRTLPTGKSGRQPNHKPVDALCPRQIPQLGQVTVASLHNRQWRGDHPELVANSHADAALTDVETHGSTNSPALHHVAISNWMRPALFGI